VRLHVPVLARVLQIEHAPSSEGAHLDPHTIGCKPLLYADLLEVPRPNQLDAILDRNAGPKGLVINSRRALAESVRVGEAVTSQSVPAAARVFRQHPHRLGSGP